MFEVPRKVRAGPPAKNCQTVSSEANVGNRSWGDAPKVLKYRSRLTAKMLCSHSSLSKPVRLHRSVQVKHHLHFRRRVHRVLTLP